MRGIVYLVLSLGVYAAPLEPRNAAPVNTGTIDLIESLEGFRANYYYIDGDKTVGVIPFDIP